MTLKQKQEIYEKIYHCTRFEYFPELVYPILETLEKRMLTELGKMADEGRIRDIINFLDNNNIASIKALEYA